MKAIIFKELRENMLCAVLIPLALGVLMAIAIYNSPNETLLVENMFHLVSAMGFAVAGFLLGLMQVLLDRRQGRWDFVIHRPMSRTRIFFSKVIAGVSLYGLICAVPLTTAVVWVATPGNVAAPFDWRMILPRLADLFGGVVWYVAGLLVAGREARWVGSRLMPAGLALLASIVADGFAMNLWEAIAIFAVAIVILLPAAWGAFVFGGEFEPQPLVIRLTQAIAVGVGIAIIIVTGLALVDVVHIYDFETYGVDLDGQVYISRIAPNGEQVLTDLHGHRLPESAALLLTNDRGYTTALALQGHERVSSIIGTGLAIMGTELQSRDHYRLDLRQGWAGVGHQINWFYLVDRRTIEGFDTRSRRYIGGIGPDGFVSAPALPQPFFEPLEGQDWSENIVWGRHSAYDLDLNDRKISRLFVSTPEDPILDAAQTNFFGSLQFDLVATRSTVYLFRDGREWMDVPLEHGYPPYYALYVSRTREGRFVFRYAGQFWNSSPGNDWIVATDEHGNVLYRRELSPLPTGIEVSHGWMDALQIVCMPPIYGWAKLIAIHAANGVQPHWDEIVVRLLGIGIACVAVALALLARRDQTRGTKIVWILIAALMGVSGVLLLLSLRHRVATVRCASCGKERLVTRDACEHCGAPFAEPARHGTEILELV